MAKLNRDILAVLPGKIYPEWVKSGDECPPELEQAAISLGAIEAKVNKRAPETK